MTNDQRDDTLASIDKQTAVIAQKLVDHIENKNLHAQPPCEGLKNLRDSHKALSNRAWAALAGTSGALISIVYGYVSK